MQGGWWFYILPISFYLIISSKWIKGNEEEEKSSRYYIILFPENIQANNPYSKQLPRPLSSFLMHPFFSPLFSCPMSHGRAKDREKGRGSEGRLAARLRKFIPEGMNREGGAKPAAMSKLFRKNARSFFPSRSRVVNSTGFGDHWFWVMIWKLFFEDFCVISGSTNSPPPLKGRFPPGKESEDYFFWWTLRWRWMLIT